MNSSHLLIMYVVILGGAKLYYHFIKNTDLHQKKALDSIICPYCKKANTKKLCCACSFDIDDIKGVACMNCGYVGEMKKYGKETEFSITVLLFAVLIVPAIFYYFAYKDRKICKHCGRMIRRSDYAIESGCE